MIIIPVYNTIILTDVQYNLEPETLTMAERNRLGMEEPVLLLPLKEDKPREEMTAADFYPIGVIDIIKALRNTVDEIAVAVRTTKRVDVTNVHVSATELTADCLVRPEVDDLPEADKRANFRAVLQSLTDIASHFQWGNWAMHFSERLTNIHEVISIIGPYADMSVEEKYALLAEDSVSRRSDMIVRAMMHYRDSIELQADITRKIQDQQGNAYREGMIRRQIELLQDELDEMDPDNVSDVEVLGKKLEAAELPPDVKPDIDRLFQRFRSLPREDHEYSSLYEYLDFVGDLPWKKPEEQQINLAEARTILDKDHYGLAKVKERILQHIAVMALSHSAKGSIILFVGAPGTGKTSMGRSIAEALGRKYVRISFGGIRDEAEIRGHRRTYIGAMPGRIMDAIHKVGVNNPVMVLDEIDKLPSRGFDGDPSSALLEVLDPEQNTTFTDHYMNVPYDLSNVVFICTANTTDTIPEPLLDRMEVIALSGYTANDKFHIAKEHLLQKSIEETGLTKKNIAISDAVLRKVVSDYTAEAGVRGLKKQLDLLCRQAAVRILEEGIDKVTIRTKDLPKLLGTKRALHDQILKKGIPGVATGLAWTQAGGEILFIETTAMPGKGGLTITGQLGDVMRESAEISMSLVRRYFAGEKVNFADRDIHIHVPSGAVPKDGPSAGITLFTALTSLVTGIPVNPEIAMTGELSLRGQVLPIGGLPEKLMAAERAGIRKVLIPSQNKDDLTEVPEETKNALEIVLVDQIRDVVREALGIVLPGPVDPFQEEKSANDPIAMPGIPTVPVRPAGSLQTINA